MNKKLTDLLTLRNNKLKSIILIIQKYFKTNYNEDIIDIDFLGSRLNLNSYKNEIVFEINTADNLYIGSVELNKSNNPILNSINVNNIKDFINWRKLSEFTTGNVTHLMKEHIPKKYKSNIYNILNGVKSLLIKNILNN